ncbi:MAG TPA: IS21 family transposase [Chloroflexota bacterium]|nr:IS21 family transposase [Chloroflexota bacterium]
MHERLKGRTQQQAAVRANLRSRHTVAKYERLGRLPSALRQPRAYRTRPDPFADSWPELAAMLERAPELEATALFDWLRERRPGVYRDGQVRTLQRRVALWRVEHTSPVLALEQVHRPGEVLQTDGVKLDHLGVTVAGAPFPHLLIHSVLPYSNWEWGRVAQSESLVALRLALGSALVRLGHVPRVHQTDRTSAATHRLVGVNDRGRAAADRGFNPEYLDLLAHYGLEPRMTHRASPNENGDVEAGNGATQRAIAQHLLLRGSRDFPSVEAYERFLVGVFEKRNAGRLARLAEELAAMRPLRVAALAPEREVRARVSTGGMIRVQGHPYAVPAGLVGKTVEAWVGEWEVGVWYGGRCWATLPRLTARGAHHVDYRYVVDTLLRKPGGFRDYRYRDDLFPTTTFRRAWEELDGRLPPRRADLAYLRVLKLAATTLQVDVERALAEALAAGEPWDDRTIAARVRPELAPAPALATGAVDLAAYDALLGDPPEADDDAA